MRPSEHFKKKINECIKNQKGLGICVYLYDRFESDVAFSCKVFLVDYIKSKGWYSGCDIYPLSPYETKGDMSDYDYEEGAWEWYSPVNNWNPDTVYGSRRIEVAKALLKFIEEKGFQ